MCSNLLHEVKIAPDLCKLTHVLQVPDRESLHIRKFMHQIRGQTVDDFRTPTLPLLPGQDVAPDLPVDEDQFAVLRIVQPGHHLFSDNGYTGLESEIANFAGRKTGLIIPYWLADRCSDGLE